MRSGYGSPRSGETRASNYLTPLLSIVAMIVIWVGAWALLSRIFAGRKPFFSANLLIALSAVFAFSFYNEFRAISSFRLDLVGCQQRTNILPRG